MNPHTDNGAPSNALPFAAREAPSKEQRSAWRRAIASGLNQEQRVLLILWYDEGLAADEIAAILETTPERVTAMHDEIVGTLNELMAAA